MTIKTVQTLEASKTQVRQPPAPEAVCRAAETDPISLRDAFEPCRSNWGDRNQHCFQHEAVRKLGEAGN